MDNIVSIFHPVLNIGISQSTPQFSLSSQNVRVGRAKDISEARKVFLS